MRSITAVPCLIDLCFSYQLMFRCNLNSALFVNNFAVGSSYEVDFLVVIIVTLFTVHCCLSE